MRTQVAIPTASMCIFHVKIPSKGGRSHSYTQAAHNQTKYGPLDLGDKLVWQPHIYLRVSQHCWMVCQLTRTLPTDAHTQFGLFRVISTFCVTLVMQNVEITGIKVQALHILASTTGMNETLQRIRCAECSVLPLIGWAEFTVPFSTIYMC